MKPGICVYDSETVERPDHTKNTRLLLNVTVKEESVDKQCPVTLFPLRTAVYSLMEKINISAFVLLLSHCFIMNI